MSVRSVLADHPKLDTFDLDQLVACLEACLRCVGTCSACADACLWEENIDHHRTCVQTCLTTADICAATAKVIGRAGPDNDVWAALVRVCRDACAACAEECERHDNDHCRSCAAACRECVAACDALLAVAD